MKKIWLIYHTKTGNCGKMCEDLAAHLKEKYELKTGNVKELNPEEIIADNPDVLLIGSRITIGSPDKTIKKFVKKLGLKLEKPIPKAATLYTHASTWDENFGKMAKILKEHNVAEDVLPDVLEIKLEGAKGPREPNQEIKITEFAQKLSNFIQ